MSRSVEFGKTNVSQAADSELRVSVPRRRKRSLAGQMIEGAELRLQVFRDIYGHGHLLAYAQESRKGPAARLVSISVTVSLA